ncbi:MAG: type II toxin-antitoxin system VapC family toxin [Candidatus Baldrarchaeia archaeon]
MEKVCIDTDVLIEYLREEKSESAKAILMLKKSNTKLAVSSITVYELFVGPLWLKRTEELQRLKELKTWLIELPLDQSAAELAAEMDTRLKREGKEIGLRDTFIAAICIVNGYSLLTKNVKHFKRVSEYWDLEVLTPKDVISM